MFACVYRPPAPERSGEGNASSAVSSLIAIAEDFSPRYECHHDDLISIDVRGLERLLGGAPTIARELARAAAARGARVHAAVARTRTAALVLALARPGVTVVEPGREAEALAPLPLDVL